MRRYAEGTTVRVEESQAEIRGLLAKHGATGFMFAEEVAAGGTARAAIQFILGGLPYRFEILRPTAEEFEEEYARTRRSGMAYSIDGKRKAEAEWRRRWRARLLWLKATLEFATAEGGDELQRVLLPMLALPGGQETMFDYAARELPGAYRSGRMPPLLLEGGS